MEKLQILSVNVRGLNSVEKRQNYMNGLNYISVMLSYYERPILLKKMNLNIMPDGRGKFFTHLAIRHTVKVFPYFIERI